MNPEFALGIFYVYCGHGYKSALSGFKNYSFNFFNTDNNSVDFPICVSVQK